MAAFSNRASHQFRPKDNEAVKNELIAAGIPYIALPSYMNTEVKTSYIGILNGFLFTRAWRYWVCTGDMPLWHAQKIYEAYGDLAVRADGDAANRPPVGKNIAYENKLKETIAILQAAGASGTEIIAALERIKEEPNGMRFVSVYHIDMEEGLAALASYIRSNNLCAFNGQPPALR